MPRREPVHFRHDAIAAPRDVLDVARCARIVTERTSQARDRLVHDVVDHDHVAPAEVEPLGDEGEPLGGVLHEGDLVGVITLGRTEVRPFGEGEVRIGEALAQQAAIAIANAGHYPHLEQPAATLKEINAWEAARLFLWNKPQEPPATKNQTHAGIPFAPVVAPPVSIIT